MTKIPLTTPWLQSCQADSVAVVVAGAVVFVGVVVSSAGAAAARRLPRFIVCHTRPTRKIASMINMLLMKTIAVHIAAGSRRSQV